MLRIITIITSLVICNQVLAQDTTFAKARQLYHKEYTSAQENDSPSIFELMNILGKQHHFTAVCPTNGEEPVLLSNEGKALHLTPSPIPLHEWEPHSWQFSEEYNSWKGICPGDSVFFEYIVEIDNRQECAPSLDLPAWGSSSSTNPWWIESTENNVQSNGSVYTYLGSDYVFNKPLILVEGFDFLPGANTEEHRHGGFGWRDIWGCDIAKTPGTQNYPIMLDSLHNEGYDIVFIDFEHGTASIEDKSILVKHVIRLCNEFKESDNPNVVVGASMGGVVARHSLATMEQDGEHHCCRIFASIDSPHKGANISPGLQAIVHLLGPLSSEAAIFSAGLNSPAAKQLLQFSYQGETEFLSTQIMLNNLGYPKNTTNLSIANSNPNVEIELEDAPLLEWSEYFFPFGTGHLLADRTNSGSIGWQQIASCALPNDFIPLNGIPIWYEYQMHYYNDGIDRDVVPSSIGRHMGSLINAINASEQLVINEDQYQEACGFISYNSALDIDENGESPFDRWHCASSWEAPEEHVELSYMHRKLILDNIILGDEMAPAELNAETIATYYSYMNSDIPHRWISNTAITEGGELAIETTVKTKPCSAIIDLGNGGTLRIGNEYALSPGELYLKSGSLLNCFGENEFAINNGSKLIVEDEAVVVLDGTTIDVKSDASLLIKPGGTLILKNGAKINLTSNTSNFDCAGQILIEGNIHSTIANQATIECTIHLENGSKIMTSPSSKLLIDGSNNLNIHVAENHTLLIDGTGTIEIINSNVFTPASSAIHSDSKFLFNNSNIYGEYGATVKTTNKVSLNECIWSNLKLLMQGAGAKALKVSNSEIVESEFYIFETGVQFEHNSFVGTSLKIQESIGLSMFDENSITGGEEIEHTILEFKNCSDVLLEENHFTLGSRALVIHESPVTLKCNHFDTWNEAVVLSGNSYVAMSPHVGGGYNHFNNNRLHIRFEDASVPWIQNGNNTFGSHSVYCFAGSFFSPTSYWEIMGNSWLASSLSNGTNGGELITNLWHNTSNLSVTAMVTNPTYSSYECPEYTSPTEMSSSKNILSQGYFDILGRENINYTPVISKPSGTGQGQLNILRDPSLK